MSIHDTDVPEFTIAMRGYDRLQVADYLGRLREYAAELEERLARADARGAALDQNLRARQEEVDRLGRQVQELLAERESGTPASIAPRLERILALAEEEAAETRRAAGAEAAATLASARAEADGLLAAGRRRAEAMAQELDVAGRNRDAVVADLRRLATQAAELADRATSPAEVRGAAVVDSAPVPSG